MNLNLNSIVSRKICKGRRKGSLSAMNENELSYKIIGVALDVHKTIGPGLLESAYENALAFDLAEQGFKVKQQVPMPFIYKGVKQDVGYRIDLLVHERLLLKLNPLKSLLPFISHKPSLTSNFLDLNWLSSSTSIANY